MAIPLALIAASGSLLLLQEPYWRARYPDLAAPVTWDARAYAATLDRMPSSVAPATLRTVRFPHAGVNAFHLYLSDGSQAFVRPSDGLMMARWTWTTSLPAFLFELHSKLLLGEFGERAGGIIGCAAVALAAAGFALWLPSRRTLRLRAALPRSVAPAAVLRSHAAVGAIAILPIAILCATGAALVYFTPLSRAVAVVLDGRPAAGPTALVAPRGGGRHGWRDILDAAAAAFPESHPTMVQLGSQSNHALVFRKRLAGEPHPNGRSYVVVDPYSAAVIEAIDARRQPRGARMLQAVYPLHSGRTAGLAGALVTALAGLSLVWLTVSGVWTWAARAWHRRGAYASLTQLWPGRAWRLKQNRPQPLRHQR